VRGKGTITCDTVKAVLEGCDVTRPPQGKVEESKTGRNGQNPTSGMGEKSFLLKKSGPRGGCRKPKKTDTFHDVSAGRRDNGKISRSRTKKEGIPLI